MRFSVTTLLLILSALTPTQLLAQANSDQAVMEGMFRSLEAANDQEKLQILRGITLFKTTTQVRREVALPKLGYLMLDPTVSEAVRRESVKAFLAMGGEKKYGMLLAPLLKENQIEVAGVIEAQQAMQEPLLLPALFWAAVHPYLHPNQRQQALGTALQQWQESECSATLDALRFAANQQGISSRPQLFSGTPNSQQTRTANEASPIEKQLRQVADGIADGGGTSGMINSGTIQWNALLVLGCIADPQNVVALIMRRFRGEKLTERLRALAFLRAWLPASAVPGLGECSRNDVNQEIRYGCKEILTAYAQAPSKNQELALQQLVRGFQQSSELSEKRNFLRQISRFPQGEMTLRQLLSDEKQSAVRIAIKKILQKEAAREAPKLFDETTPSTTPSTTTTAPLP